MLIRKIITHRNLCFFDFGMGWCNFLKAAKDSGAKCFGTELSIDRIEYAKSLGVEVIDIDQISNYEFDIICNSTASLSLLCHITA